MTTKRVFQRQEEFDNFTINGVLFTSSDGERFWQMVVLRPSSSEAREVNVGCIVSGDNIIRCVRAGIDFPSMEVVTGESVSNIEPAVKKAIQMALEKWEREYAEQTQ
ncbi:MAG TPA: hypothetical protein VGR47_03920 [Terracidiphilus sp.]|nr:hypothetical protein [Terracidiphilus sp.]